jgi:hypothetical protein
MAKIPRYEEQVRLDSFGPSQMYSGREARMTGEALANLGQDLGQFAGKLDAYRTAKDTADESIFAKEWKDNADIIAQNAKQAIETNADGKVSSDGKNILPIYDGAFEELRAQALQIPDERRRRIALNAIGMGQTSYRKDMQGLSETTYNAHMFRSAEKSMNVSSAKAFNDPAMARAQIKEYTEFINKIPAGVENKAKMIKEAEKSIALAAVSRFQEDGNYKKAKELINGELSEYFTTEDRVKLLEKNESEYKQDVTFKSTLEAQERAEKRNKFADMKTDNMSKAYDMIVSDDPVQRANGFKQAKDLLRSGAIELKDFNNLTKTGQAMQYQDSDSEFLRMTDKLVSGEDTGNFTDDVMANSKLHPKQARQLLMQYNSLRKGRTADPEKKTKMAGGTKFIKDAFPVSSFDRITDETYKKNAMAAKATQLYLKALEAGEKDPYKAAVKAVKEVDPHNKMVAVFSGDTAGALTKRKPQDVRGELFEIKKQLTILRERSPKEADEYAKKMKKTVEGKMQELKALEQEADIVRSLKEKE